MEGAARLQAGERVSFGAFLLRSILPAVGVVVFALLVHGVIRPHIGDFHAKVMIGIAINIVLAVSLTIVNGYTGQFSMGHAGFMAVGGYVGAVVTFYGSFRIWGDPAPHGGWLSWP